KTCRLGTLLTRTRLLNCCLTSIYCILFRRGTVPAFGTPVDFAAGPQVHLARDMDAAWNVLLAAAQDTERLAGTGASGAFARCATPSSSARGPSRPTIRS